jgi:cell division GTPase FtsZ
MSGNAHAYRHDPKTSTTEKEVVGNIKSETEKEEMSDDMIDDDFLVDVPDFPMPEEAAAAVEAIQDEFYKSEEKPGSAFKFAFIGCGQGGSRIAESFYKLGYRRVCCINTTNQDLKGIDIPEANKLVIGEDEGGAGKNPENGSRIARNSYDEIFDLMKRSFGTDFDRIFVCIGAGGGTGSGSSDIVIEVAHSVAEDSKKEKEGGQPIVGAICSMPKLQEGGKVNANAYSVLESLFRQVGPDDGKLGDRSLSPLVVVDNDRIDKIYPKLPVAKFWDVANRNISSLFHLFNSIAIKDSEFTTFDRADFKDLLQSGVVSFGACPVRNWEQESGISHAIRTNLKNNVLVGGLDLTQARKAGCIFIASSEVLNEIPNDNLEHGFEGLSRIMQKGSTIHRGIYKGSKDGLVVYTLMGELGRPTERMEEIAKKGNVTIKKK